MAAQTPQATELPGKLFDIQKTWKIGGEGNWDYLTLDPVALKLYIAHGPVVQIVDVNTGTLAGEVVGMHEAHGIALDDNGQYGYISDGPANDVKVFDRQTLEIAATIPTGKNPRAVVFEPVSRLIFVICPDAMTSESRIPRRITGSGQNVPATSDPFVNSTVNTVIDADTQSRVADLILPGKLGFAQADGKGMVYVNITDRNRIAYFSAQDIQGRLRKLAGEDAPDTPKSNGSKAGIPRDSAPSDRLERHRSGDAAHSPAAAHHPPRRLPVAARPGRGQRQPPPLCSLRKHENGGSQLH